MIAQAQLEQDLYRGVTSRTFPSESAAAQAFGAAYQRFAIQVMSGTGGRPMAVPAAVAQLVAAVAAAYRARSRPGTASILAQGLLAFWQMQAWSGGSGPGQTSAPGHAATRTALARLYEDGTTQGDARHHARELARICAEGVRAVVVTEYPPLRPPDVTPAC